MGAAASGGGDVDGPAADLRQLAGPSALPADSQALQRLFSYAEPLDADPERLRAATAGAVAAMCDNLSSGNVPRLVEHLIEAVSAAQASGAAEARPLLNALCLHRRVAHAVAERSLVAAAYAPGDVGRRLLAAVVDGVVRLPPGPLVAELVRSAVVLLSGQLYHAAGAPGGRFFVDAAMALPAATARALVQRLMEFIMSDSGAAAAAAAGEGTAAADGGGAGARLLALPWTVYFLLRPGGGGPAQGEPGVGALAAVLLLLLVHNDRTVDNPFVRAVAALTDDAYVLDEEAAPAAGEAIAVKFDRLFAALTRDAGSDHGVLLLYSLLQGNGMVAQAVLARSDLDTLLLPVLRLLHESTPDTPRERLYMLVILQLIFSQDAAFNDTAHSDLVVPAVPWVRDQLLRNISLGSLQLALALRAMLMSLTVFQNPYLQQSYFAVLSNMAPHCRDLHPFAAQRVVSMLDLLFRRYQRLSSTGSGASADEEKLASTGDALRLLLDFLTRGLVPERVAHNIQLVYAVLHARRAVAGCCEHPDFAASGAYVLTLLRHFEALLEARGDEGLSVEAVVAVIEEGARAPGALVAAAGAMPVSDAKFRYEETAQPEAFFLPCVWGVAIRMMGQGEPEWAKGGGMRLLG